MALGGGKIMAFNAEIKILKTKELLAAIRMAPVALEIEMADAFDHIRRKHFKTWKRTTRVNFTLRVGILNRFHSFVKRRKGKLNALKMDIFSFSNIALVHEKGATIRGKGTRLRIPIPGSSVTNRSGNQKKAFRGRSLRDDKRFFVIPNRDLMVRRFRGKNARIEPVFALKKSVRIRKRLNFMGNWDQLTSFRNQRLNTAVARAVSAMGRAKAV